MVRITWTGVGTYTDHGRSFRAASGSTHDVGEEQAEAYLNHDLFGDDWKLADGEESTESDASDDADESQDTAEGDEAAADDTTICGAEMSGGDICERPADECPYHDPDGED